MNSLDGTGFGLYNLVKKTIDTIGLDSLGLRRICGWGGDGTNCV